MKLQLWFDDRLLCVGLRMRRRRMRRPRSLHQTVHTTPATLLASLERRTLFHASLSTLVRFHRRQSRSLCQQQHGQKHGGNQWSTHICFSCPCRGKRETRELFTRIFIPPNPRSGLGGKYHAQSCLLFNPANDGGNCFCCVPFCHSSSFQSQLCTIFRGKW